jgi:pilus assembly protein CpaD
MTMNDRRIAVRMRTIAFLLPMAAAVALVGCRPDLPGGAIETATLPPVDRAAVMVAERPQALSLDVRSADGLTGGQQALVVRFLNSYRAQGREAGPITLAVSAGGAFEGAAIAAASDVRQIAHHLGIEPARLHVVPGSAGRRGGRLELSYAVVEIALPECGYWPENLARNPYNEPYANKGCATERNAAVMLARPADMLGPRGMTPRSAERRDDIWGKYVKGQSTISQKQDGERLKE